MERVEFHTRFNEGNVRFDQECGRQPATQNYAGMNVRIVRWRERAGGEGLHNRYVLTERGGLSLAWGLDEGAPQQTDDLSLLGETLYRIR